ncbi:MAG: hypothetical protein IJO57_02415 [Bacilli bacterium]|nr:hypothetical protein [Bacilli bacterium]
MESKIIKIRTNGDILRDAYVISGFVIDGSEYVVYYADRDDGESDNIFVSKLIKNTDGTYNMLDIENANEKIGVSNVVKELIVTAVKDNEHDTLDTNVCTLADDKVINIFSLIINREQTVDVQKTYISSVKKAVSEVARKYFDIKVETPVVEQSPADSLFTDIPVVELTETVSEVAPSIPEVAAPVVTETVPTAVDSVEPVLPEIPVQEVKVEQTAPVLEVPTELITPAVPEVTPVVTPVQEVKPVTVEPVPTPVTPVAPAPVVPTVVEPIPEPVKIEPETLVLDASKETNLNTALGEAGNEGLAVNDINAIKDFGVEESVTVATTPVSTPVNQDGVPTNTNKAGFANNKFFVFLALAFFFGSCVFLGYEVFNYFQIVK